MRLLILILGLTEALFLISGIVMNLVTAHKTDAAGQGMAYSLVVMLAVVLILFLIPALGLAYFDKWLWFALVLLIISILLTIVCTMIA